MLTVRKRHIKKDSSGRQIYERLEGTRLIDGVIESVTTETGMDEETYLRWFSEYVKVLALEQQQESDEQRNRIYEKDVDRKSLAGIPLTASASM
jgi:hypothetical protein